MARIRTIKPEFPQSESMGRVSRDARLTFIELWTLADDEGRLRGNSRMLASLLFPYDDDAPSLIDTWLTELESENCIVRYQVDGQSYLQICKWLEHQKIDRASKSKIPPLSNAREDSRGLVLGVDQGVDQGMDQGVDLNTLPNGRDGKPAEKPPSIPPCPIDSIITLYHETLPECPKFVVRNKTREGFIRSRWRDFYVEGDFQTSEEGLLVFRRYFAEMVKPSKFLTGRADARNGRDPFVADLEWLMRPSNFAKVVEGKYS